MIMTPTNDAPVTVEQLVKAAADAHSAFIAARQRMNDAIPALDATPAERAVYDERYRADHAAEREHWRTAIELAQNAHRLAALASAPAAGSREAAMVTLRTDDDGHPKVWCDPEIADLIDALNTEALSTVASCSGHGHRPGIIMLADGRCLMVFHNREYAKAAEAAYPLDINGVASAPAGDGVEALRALSDAATSGPWSWEQCGEREDVPVIGIAFAGDDPDCKAPYEGEFRDSDANRMTIAYDWQSCDGHSPSSNAAFAVAAVNYVRAALARPRAAVGERPDDEALDPHLPDTVKSERRCGIQRSDWMTSWFVPWSPRNDNQNAEGPWSHWVALAHAIIAADEKAILALQSPPAKVEGHPQKEDTDG